MSSKIKTNDFIKKSKDVHGDKYDYSLVDYKNNYTKIKIICSLHGIFEQLPKSHLNNNGCKNCHYEKRTKTTTFFIEQSKEIHGDKYDYSLTEYINAKTKVKIICNDHGIFEQRPYDHKKGMGCKNCNYRTKLTKENFIKKSKKVHGDKYDYSLVEYKNNNTNINIICKKHDIFLQKPNHHMNGSGCSKCSNNHNYSKVEFIEKSKKVHGDKYDYSLVEYKNIKTKIKLICPLHGIFIQKPKDHINSKTGCPICNESKGEKEISNILSDNNINFVYQKKFKNLKYIKPLSFDFYLPEHNMCIEYDGEQHFKIVKKWGGEHQLKNIIIRDKIKNEYCKINNIRLIRIKYNENITEKIFKSLKFLLLP